MNNPRINIEDAVILKFWLVCYLIVFCCVLNFQ